MPGWRPNGANLRDEPPPAAENDAPLPFQDTERFEEVGTEPG
jgi:hypothetical protein